MSAPLAFVVAGGCGAETGRPDARALRRSFPSEEAAVLGHGEGFHATDQGFSSSAPEGFGGFRRLAAELPRVGSGAIRITTLDGFEVRVRELSAEGEGAAIEKAVAYRRAGGTAYWTAAPDKVEEWVHLTAARGALPLTWEVEGAAVEQRGENVALVDGEGVARLWVSAPAAFAAGGRPIKPELRAENGRIELDIKGAEGEILVDPAWTTLPPMTTPRVWHTATAISKGRVLVAGGSGAMMATAAAETYDPGSNAWEPVPSMMATRERHAATLLDNGDVLITGGFNGAHLQSAEIFSASTDMWTSITSMAQGRSRHTATKLGNGKVLVVGGINGPSAVASSELFDMWDGYWPAPPLPSTGRSEHTATLLGNGTILVTGGKGPNALKTAEIFRPQLGTWKATSSLSTARYGHTATLLFDGRVLIAGGTDGMAALASAEIFEPGTEMWSTVASLGDGRVSHAAVALSNGKVLVTGGSKGGMTLASAEMYDPDVDKWLGAGLMSESREGHTATRLGDGRVLIAGGKKGNNSFLSSSEMFEALPLGAACVAGSDCLSGFCADAVCCNQACDAGPCDVCTVAAGGKGNGICEILNGNMCDDMNACTVGDTCQAGVCVGGPTVQCMEAPPCKTTSCDPATGKCVVTNVPDGDGCMDGNGCTELDQCVNGECKGTDRQCKAFDLCHEVGVCDPKSGMCSDPDKLDCELPDEVPPKPTVPAEAVECGGADECASGFCREGVCCDSDCQMLCHSCTVPGSIGKCTPVPFGSDPLHHCGNPETCTKTCSGTGDGKCVDAAVGTVCAPQQCFHDGIHGAMAMTCSGVGVDCPGGDRIPFNCSPYRCNTTFGACNTKCTELADCAEPYVCSPEGACVAAPAISSGYASSCSVGRRGAGVPSSAGVGGLALLIAALGGAARARRRERSPRSAAR